MTSIKLPRNLGKCRPQMLTWISSGIQCNYQVHPTSISPKDSDVSRTQDVSRTRDTDVSRTQKFPPIYAHRSFSSNIASVNLSALTSLHEKKLGLRMLLSPLPPTHRSKESTVNSVYSQDSVYCESISNLPNWPVTEFGNIERDETNQ